MLLVLSCWLAPMRFPRGTPDAVLPAQRGPLHGQRCTHFSLPNKPAGRSSSTITITTKTTVAEPGG
jgi:hypothetical protein